MRKLVVFFTLFLFLPMAMVAQAEEKKDEEKERLPPVYYQLTPSIVSNLTGGPRFLRCDVQIQAVDQEAVIELETHAPALRHEFLLVLTAHDGKALKTAAGKEKLRKDAIVALQKTMKEMTGKDLVKDLFFTSFYVR